MEVTGWILSQAIFNISEFEVTKPEALLLLSPHNLEEKKFLRIITIQNHLTIEGLLTGSLEQKRIPFL